MTFTYKNSTVIEEPVTHLRADCGVRYWEDGTVDGVEDADGSRIPCRNGDRWQVDIDLATGAIVNWTPGITAKVHYKVCDDGLYSLLDEHGNIVVQIDGYVPKMMAPADEDHGFGDYVVMNIGPDGVIADWEADLSHFEGKDDA